MRDLRQMATAAPPDTGAIHDSLMRDLRGSDSPWAVILFNDESHTFEDVAVQLQKAIGCTLEAGFEFATVVDSEGSANVFQGDLEACERVASVLEEIALKVKIQVQ
jgi:ATP-dependent Clp protease adapter protein ClpS